MSTDDPKEFDLEMRQPSRVDAGAQDSQGSCGSCEGAGAARGYEMVPVEDGKEGEGPGVTEAGGFRGGGVIPISPTTSRRTWLTSPSPTHPTVRHTLVRDGDPTPEIKPTGGRVGGAHGGSPKVPQ